MNVNLVIVQPLNYVHSLGFLDVAQYMRFWLEKLGCVVTLSKNRLRQDAVNIILGAHLGVHPSWLSSDYCVYFFNLEQIGLGGADVSDSYLDILKTARVIDYDLKNVECYRPHSMFEVPLVPFWNAPYLNRDHLMPDWSHRPIDLLFFGSVNSERKALLKRIESAGWDVTVFDSPTYFEERDEFVRQAKAVINMSYYSSARFEQVRAFNVLSHGTAFISYLLPTQLVPNDFIEPIFWINDKTFDKFFTEEFASPGWFLRAHDKYISWVDRDPRSSFGILLSTLEDGWAKHMQTLSTLPVNLVQIVQFDDGSYFHDAVNVSPDEINDVDLLIDLRQVQEWPWTGVGKRGQCLELHQGQIERIVMRDSLLDSYQWHGLLTNAMELLCETGELVLELPIDEVMLQGELVCLFPKAQKILSNFSEKFWRSGQLSHCFEFKNFQLINDLRKPVDGALATSCRLIYEKRSTTPRERTLARLNLPDFGISK